MSFFGLHQSKKSLHSITPSRRQHWTKIGPAETHLYESVKNLYWIGVEQEVENILRTLSTWQRGTNSQINIEDEDDQIHGYDTFLDQVSKEARDFAAAYGTYPELSTSLNDAEIKQRRGKQKKQRKIPKMSKQPQMKEDCPLGPRSLRKSWIPGVIRQVSKTRSRRRYLPYHLYLILRSWPVFYYRQPVSVQYRSFMSK